MRKLRSKVKNCFFPDRYFLKGFNFNFDSLLWPSKLSKLPSNFIQTTNNCILETTLRFRIFRLQLKVILNHGTDVLKRFRKSFRNDYYTVSFQFPTKLWINKKVGILWSLHIQVHYTPIMFNKSDKDTLTSKDISDVFGIIVTSPGRTPGPQ